jgi:hypothetical protein
VATSHFSGAAASLTPDAAGPRNCGQLPFVAPGEGRAKDVTTAANPTAMVRVNIVMGRVYQRRE